MIVFPELFLPGYNQSGLLNRDAQTRGEGWEAQLCKTASKIQCAITIGWAERDGDQVFNAASTFGAGRQVLARYRKLQLFGPTEAAIFSPGDDYTVFDFEGIKTALLICYDIEFSHHARCLAEQGVELILVPTANSEEYPNVPEILVPARALESGLSVAYANYCGTENELTYSGGSVIVGPDGNALAKAGKTETLLISEIPKIASYAAHSLSTQLQDFRKLT